MRFTADAGGAVGVGIDRSWPSPWRGRWRGGGSPGGGRLVTLMGAPFLLPVIVAVLGLLAVFGRSGLLNSGLAALGLPPVSIYGLHGVVLAHVFLNLPLAVRMILQGWLAIPAERFRLAQSLGFGPAQMLRHLEAPMLREVLPGVALVILVICLTSFAVVLTLGGGPAATTIELAIYQAVRFDFDLGRAAGLAGVQVAICALAALAAWVLMRPAGFGAGLDRRAADPGPRRVAAHGGWRSADRRHAVPDPAAAGRRPARGARPGRLAALGPASRVAVGPGGAGLGHC